MIVLLGVILSFCFLGMFFCLYMLLHNEYVFRYQMAAVEEEFVPAYDYMMHHPIEWNIFRLKKETKALLKRGEA